MATATKDTKPEATKTPDPVPSQFGTLSPEAPQRVDRPTDAEGNTLPPEGMLSVNPGFPAGPMLIAAPGAMDDTANAAQHIGWVRPVAAPDAMPDVSTWKAWEWVATSSARDNFDRVLLRPGQVTRTEQDVYDAETCEKEYTLAGGVVLDGYYIPTNYVDRRRRALTLRVYDVTVPESLAFKLPAAK